MKIQLEKIDMSRSRYNPVLYFNRLTKDYYSINNVREIPYLVQHTFNYRVNNPINTAALLKLKECYDNNTYPDYIEYEFDYKGIE